MGVFGGVWRTIRSAIIQLTTPTLRQEDSFGLDLDLDRNCMLKGEKLTEFD